MATAPAALLLLADGTLLRGTALGGWGTAVGELCFNTGMTGYQEVFTDPSYLGQIVVTTHSHIGNYGVTGDEMESTGGKIAGLVVRNFSDVFSRSQATASLQDFLVQQHIPGIAGVDTRALVRHIRAAGAMNAVLSTEILQPALLQEQLAACPPMLGLELASQVMPAQPYAFCTTGHHKVAVLDYGVKQHILQSLGQRGCQVQVFPGTSTAGEVLAWQPQGILLSNGPGDPAAMPAAVAQVQALLQASLPIFGICLGHQLLALAAGATTYKMPYGHRGLNHPVKNSRTGLCEITSQNHGFAVHTPTLEAIPGLQVTHRNLNDGSLEGFRWVDKPVFAVQYHPEAHPGPHDSGYLFDEFIALLR